MEKKRITKRVKGTPIPTSVGLNKKWGKHFSHESGLAFRLPRGAVASLFLDKRLNSSSQREVLEVLGTETVAGYVISCEGKEWEVRLEPTETGRFGISVYTESGKALIGGHGSVSKKGRWQVRFRTLYPGIRNKKPVHLQGGIKGGTGERTEIQGAITGTFP